MKRWLWRLLRSPQFDDTEQTAIAKQLHIILLIGIPIAVFFPILFLIFGRSEMSAFWVDMGAALICCALFGLIRRQKLRFVSVAMISTAFVTVILSLILHGGIRDDAVFAIPLILLMTSVFLGGNATVIMGVVILVTVTGLFFIESQGWIQGETSEPVSINTLLIISMTVALMTAYLRLTVNQIVLTAQRLQQQALSLQKSNQELEEIRTSLERRTQELSVLNENLRTAHKQLVESEKMAALGSLVAGVAHEINTPIGVGVTAASTLEDETQDLRLRYQQASLTRSDLEGYLEIAASSSRLLLRNLQQAANLVQSFKQVAVDQTTLERRTFRLKHYLEEVIQSLAPTLKRTNHVISVEGDQTLELDSYPGALAQVITNLVINSMLHGYPNSVGGHFQLCFVRQGRQLRLDYQDDGCGIPAADLGRIFEPFFTTARGRGGTGLGLHIVYNLITQTMGGTIQCESQSGAGTKFTITLAL
ncbi:MAG: HAMP domain-containing histidine kinase [Chloroflexota bacterium]|nr:HAMP domain-containing histidine kinase [Chloroflexota bacterium]